MTKKLQKRKKPRKRRGLFFKIFKYTSLSFITAILLGFVFVFSYLMGLDEWKEFDPRKVGEMQQTLLIYDKNGEQTAALYAHQNRVYVPINEIPQFVRQAFIAIEDERFYEHSGVDLIRIAGAFLEDLKNGNLNQGASTISQQLVKNTSLTGVKTISRKLQEAVMAYKLEQVYTKDQILEMYLNYIPFGNGAYGIEAASRVYFGVSVSELTLAQAALLAGIIKAPSHYAPHLDLERSIERRNLVLYLMQEQGYISESQEKKAQAEPVVLAETPKFQYGYFTDMVLSEAKEILSVSMDDLLSSGYSIYTTIDQELQNELEYIYTDVSNFPDDASDGEKCQSAVCVLDSQTSEIRAIMGGRSYETRFGLNRAINMKRQPGSAIKPVLVYAPAMEKLGYKPTTLVLDEKGDFNGYVPKDFSNTYKGWVTLRQALSESLNLPAVRTLQDVGVEAAKLYASNVGIPFEEEDTGLTLALGGFTTGVSPLTLCNSFTPFANGGYYSYPSCVVKIEDSSGNIVYKRPETKVNVLSHETSFLMTTMLESAATTGTARRLEIEGVSIAAKTGTAGTSGGNRDAWTIAYNPAYTICCWMGFDSTNDTHFLPLNVTGGTYPAVVIKKVFESIYNDREAPEFQQPQDIVQAKIDKQSILENGEPQLASVFTPDDQTLTEYFREEDVPEEYTSYWVVPSPPDDLFVTHGNGGYPLISFTSMQAFACYRLMRIDADTNETQTVGEYSGDEGFIEVIDDTAEYNHAYIYYVVPFHPEVQTSEGFLTGPASNRVEIEMQTEERYRP